jgi:hypothetical protein
MNNHHPVDLDKIQKTMNTYLVDLNTKLATIYYNTGKLNLFRVCVDVMLLDLKDQLYEINHQINQRDTRMVETV